MTWPLQCFAVTVGGEYVVWLNDSGSELLSFAPLDGDAPGWSRYFRRNDGDGDPWHDAVVVLVRFGLLPPRFDRHAGEPIRIRQVNTYAEHGEGLAARQRDIPYQRFESSVNQPRHYAALLPVMTHDHFGPEPPSKGLWRSEPPELADEPPRLVLEVPATGARKPDEFYRAVGEAFAWLSATDRRPAESLAEMNGVPVTTVHRWVREARQRGALPPATGRGTRRRRGDVS